jgi:hypothetical protein
MSTANEALRKPQVVKPITKELLVSVAGCAVGDTATVLTVPANKFVTGACLSNPANDLAGGTGATIGLKVGSVQLIADTTVANMKAKGIGAIDASPDFSATARTVSIVVGTADLTAGTMVVKVTYI